eukprot:11386593-Heterocapsa_arctica.AAC.1
MTTATFHHFALYLQSLDGCQEGIKHWAMQLNDGRFSSPETLVWEIAARGEFARLKGRHFVAAYIDCSKCYERVEHKVAAEAATAT